MQNNIYKNLILEHWQYPRRFGIVNNPDIKHKEENYSCGDSLEVTIKLEQKKLADVLFTAEGCAISMAYASLFLESVVGKTLGEVEKVSSEEALALVGAELSTSRIKCALLCYRTVQEGIKHYRVFRKS